MSRDAAIEALARGMVVGVPTDTVYGLAADPFNADGVQRIFDVKGRADNAPIVVLAASLDQVERIVELSSAARRLVAPHWPGALTAVLEATTEFAPGVGDSERNTLGVRIPDHDGLRELMEFYGPLAVTSANRSGEPPALDDLQARAVFGDEIPVYVTGSGAIGVASTVANLTVDPPQILRQGSIVL